MERIVVGVDGSDNGAAALAWALDEAALRGATVEAVHAYHVPYSGGVTVAPLVLDPREFRQAAETALADALSDVEVADGVTITQQVVEGPASTVLVEAGRGATMVVVGARGHGGLAGMLLGSVSRQVSEHSTVPVVVVPSQSD